MMCFISSKTLCGEVVKQYASLFCRKIYNLINYNWSYHFRLQFATSFGWSELFMTACCLKTSSPPSEILTQFQQDLVLFSPDLLSSTVREQESGLITISALWSQVEAYPNDNNARLVEKKFEAITEVFLERP